MSRSILLILFVCLRLVAADSPLTLDADAPLTASDLGWHKYVVRCSDPEQILRCRCGDQVSYRRDPEGASETILIRKPIFGHGEQTIEIKHLAGASYWTRHEHSATATASTATDERVSISYMHLEGEDVLRSIEWEFTTISTAAAVKECPALARVLGWDSFGYNHLLAVDPTRATGDEEEEREEARPPAKPDTQAGAWYERLPPDATRAQVHALAGAPAGAQGDTEHYALADGRLVLRYSDDRLADCTLEYHDRRQGVSRNYYCSGGGTLQPEQQAVRRRYLAAGDFTRLPDFAGPWIRTSRPGRFYPLADGTMLHVIPITPLMGAVGPFADKAARVALVGPDGEHEELYTAAGNWAALCPPDLLPGAVRTRTALLRELGPGVIGQAADALFGQPDGRMGSGTSYLLYYLDDCLAVIWCGPASEAIEQVWIERPGRDSLSLAQWLAQER
ncbi:MAG: hypothetical protein ACOCZK_03980 [Planctomycetota bacterium]